MSKFLIIIFCVCSLFFLPKDSHAFKEDFGFLVLELPFGWEVTKKNNTDFTIRNQKRTATFSYKIMPVYHVTIEKFSKAIMQAYGGYNLKMQAHNTYYFDFISGGKPAWSIIQFYEENAIIQTGVGESDDFSLLIDAGELK